MDREVVCTLLLDVPAQHRRLYAILRFHTPIGCRMSRVRSESERGFNPFEPVRYY